MQTVYIHIENGTNYKKIESVERNIYIFWPDLCNLYNEMILLELEVLPGFITYLQRFFSQKDTQMIPCLMTNREYVISEHLDNGMKIAWIMVLPHLARETAKLKQENYSTIIIYGGKCVAEIIKFIGLVREISS